MVDKKAFMKTMEVVIAIVLTMSVLVFVFSNFSSDADIPQPNVLSNLEFNPEFRDCVINNNETCVSDMINASLSNLYRESFEVVITDDLNYIPDDLPTKRVHVDSIIISGDIKVYSPKIVKLFYW